LMSRQLSYVRYVDDFRIFCDSERTGVEAAHALAEYLYTAHRLVLAYGKTRLLPTKRFIETELLDPEEEEERGKVTKLTAEIDQILENTGYEIEFENLPESDRKKLTRTNLKELFERAVNSKPLHLGLTRYLLRRAKYLHTAVLHQIALDNLTNLAPAMREVTDYLVRTVNAANASSIGEAILDHMQTSSVGILPFVRLWGLEFFIKRAIPALNTKVMKITEDSRDTLGLRPIALLARANKQIEWVRAQKEKWSNHAPWDLRAIVWAASILPSDERKHWCRLIRETSLDPLDRAVAEAAAKG